jgi:hypothetical protein
MNENWCENKLYFSQSYRALGVKKNLSIIAQKVGERRRIRPRTGWMERIKNVLKEGVRSTRCRRARMRVEEAKGVCKDRVRWRSIFSANLLDEY